MNVSCKIVWALLLGCTLSAEAFACTCRPQDKSVASMTPEEQAKYIYEKAVIIIRGEVTRVDAMKHRLGMHLGFHLVVQLTETEVLKGDPSITRFYTALDEAGCGASLRYALPKTYYGSLDEEGRLWVYSCFWWTYVQPARIDADFLYGESKTLQLWRQLRDLSRSSSPTAAPTDSVRQ